MYIVLRKQKWEDHTFSANLVYIASSRPARAIQDPVSKTNKQTNKKQISNKKLYAFLKISQDLLIGILLRHLVLCLDVESWLRHDGRHDCCKVLGKVPAVNWE